MTPYLDSLRQYADFPVTFVGVEFIPPDLGEIETISMTAEQNYGAPEQTKCIQHGSFASLIPGDDSEVLIYTDGDFIMQRALDDYERSLLELDDYAAVTSWNGGPHETLELEAGRLGMRTSMDDLIAAYGRCIKLRKIYNVGFLAMTRVSWIELHKAYLREWERVGGYFSHMARQQWLISYLLKQLDYDITIAPWSLHAHGHFGLKPGMERRADGIYHAGTLAAFRHYL
ncbi:MAG: hypothetical protein WC455_14460 [Dehalococcoidia bacterium]|jgi:hypothetical protein